MSEEVKHDQLICCAYSLLPLLSVLEEGIIDSVQEHRVANFHMSRINVELVLHPVYLSFLCSQLGQ